MANSLYDIARRRWAAPSADGSGIDWLTDTIKVIMVHVGSAGGGYTVNLATDQFLSDIPSSAIAQDTGPAALYVALGSKAIVAGAVDAADSTFTAVNGTSGGGTSATLGALVIYKDTGTPSTSALIAYIDTATGLPITPNSGNIIIQWGNDANRIFKL